MSDFLDELETRDPEQRERVQFSALTEQLANAKSNAPAFAALLAGIDPEAVTNRAALARLPVLRKSELMERQKEGPDSHRPFGGLTAVATSRLARIFVSPGPIYDPEGRREDWWRLARALYAAGFRRGDVIHNCFSYHFTPAGMMLESGAHEIGCAVIPAGVGSTEQQVRAIADVRPVGYVGTPSFLKIILDKGKELSGDLSSLKKALVSGEALPPSLRAELKGHGIDVRQCYATADLGLIGYESIPDAGLIIDEWVIVEIVRPGTGDPVGPGEVGEVVVTTLNPEYPLIRFATGDLSMLLPGTSACGRTAPRLKGWMGRADQTTKVRGMFVHPSQVAEVCRRHPAIAKCRVVVDRDGSNDTMTFSLEVAPSARAAGLDTAIAETIQTVTKLRGSVVLVDPGSLPNDGKVIADMRKND
ncbi:MAG: phenylacetate--CoA ligase [Alphaproteobacteria bacterium]|nr:phenylacetate--CoA ligase [Alphaproteobacteria bacterium]